MTFKNVFIRVFYDSDSIKEASVWKIALTDENNHLLYIETLHENVSDKIPENKFVELIKQSYFKGLSKVDSNINCLNLVNTMNENEENHDINIFIDSNENIIKKINKYINDFIKPTLKENEKILFVFKDSFEEILFMEFTKKEFYNNKILTLNLKNVLLDSFDYYSTICEQSFNQSLNDLKDNKEMTSLFCYIRILIECLLLKDIFKIINN